MALLFLRLLKQKNYLCGFLVVFFGTLTLFWIQQNDCPRQPLECNYTFSVIRNQMSFFHVCKFVLGMFSTDDPGPKKSRTCKTKLKNQDGQLFNVESHSGKQLRHFKFLSVSFMSQLLTSQSLVKKVITLKLIRLSNCAVCNR